MPSHVSSGCVDGNNSATQTWQGSLSNVSPVAASASVGGQMCSATIPGWLGGFIYDTLLIDMLSYDSTIPGLNTCWVRDSTHTCRNKTMPGPPSAPVSSSHTHYQVEWSLLKISYWLVEWVDARRPRETNDERLTHTGENLRCETAAATQKRKNREVKLIDINESLCAGNIRPVRNRIIVKQIPEAGLL